MSHFVMFSPLLLLTHFMFIIIYPYIFPPPDRSEVARPYSRWKATCTRCPSGPGPYVLSATFPPNSTSPRARPNSQQVLALSPAYTFRRGLQSCLQGI